MTGKWLKIFLAVLPVITGASGYVLSVVIEAEKVKAAYAEKIECSKEKDALKNENVELYKDFIMLQSKLSYYQQ